jgi:hypothetical protein
VEELQVRLEREVHCIEKNHSHLFCCGIQILDVYSKCSHRYDVIFVRCGFHAVSHSLHH